MSRYEPLARFLDDANRSPVRLSFAEIEQLLGVPLPRSARLYPAWWSNSNSHTQAVTWMSAGWETEQLDLGGETIVFVRRSGRPPAPPTQQPDRGAGVEVIVLARAALSTGLRRAMAEMRAERGLDEAAALLVLADEAVAARRVALLDEFAVGDGRSGDSAAMIRADRDAR